MKSNPRSPNPPTTTTAGSSLSCPPFCHIISIRGSILLIFLTPTSIVDWRIVFLLSPHSAGDLVLGTSRYFPRRTFPGYLVPPFAHQSTQPALIASLNSHTSEGEDNHISSTRGGHRLRSPWTTVSRPLTCPIFMSSHNLPTQNGNTWEVLTPSWWWAHSCRIPIINNTTQHPDVAATTIKLPLLGSCQRVLSMMILLSLY